MRSSKLRFEHGSQLSIRIYWNETVMNLQKLVFIFAILILPAFARAQPWTTPDGFLAVETPDAQKFEVFSMPPEPFIKLWISNDKLIKFGVMQTQLPTEQRLLQASMEEGLAEEIGGKVTRLPTKNISGYEVWVMTATGPAFTLTQAIIQDKNRLYKVMALTNGAASDQNAVDQFIESIAIARPQAEPSIATPAATPIKDAAEGVSIHQISKVAGGIGFLVGVGLLAYFALRGKSKAQA